MARWERPHRILLVFLVGAGVAALCAVPFRGIPWDEPVQRAYGQTILEWYGSGFRDSAATDTREWNLPFYGGLIEAPLEFAVRLIGRDPYVVRHAVVSLLALLGILGVYHLGRLVSDPWTGLLAALFLLGMPRYLGHGAFNSKDLPFAVAYVWALVSVVRDLRRGSCLSWPRVVPVGICLGMAMGIRVAGAMLLLPAALGYGLWSWEEKIGRRGLVLLGARSALVVVIAWVVMLAAWPWAWEAPILRPIVTLAAMNRFPYETFELFNGQLISSLALPPSYVPIWLMRTLPEATMLGMALLLVPFLSGRVDLRGLRKPESLTVALGFFLPLVWVVVSGSALYDGLRHLLFLLPFFALLAALGLRAGIRALARPWAIALLGLTGLAWATALVDAALLFPYEYVYFNRLSGGVRQAEKRFELDYWGLSYREGAEWLSGHYYSEEGTSVASCSRPESTEHFLSDWYHYAGSRFLDPTVSASIFLMTAPQDCGGNPPEGKVLHRVERSGASLLTVVRPPDLPETGPSS